MVKPILVTGGTGTLGRVVVQRLLDRGREVRVLTRRARPAGQRTPYAWMTGDLRGGAGVDTAVAGVDAIVHCASSFRGGDVETTRNLIASAQRSGSPHLVYISIVGIDRVPLGYYRTKLRAEGVIEDSELPWTVLRTTQFHDLVLGLLERAARSPVMPVPGGTSFQPIDVREVADRLAELAAGAPRGRVPDMGGPQVLSTRELARAYLRATGRHRLVLPVRMPGAAALGYRRGGHLAPELAVGRITFEQFLAERY